MAVPTQRDQSRRGDSEPMWLTLTGRRVTVHAPAGSYAAKRAASELRAAESAIALLEGLLKPPDDHNSGPTLIYLTDPVGDLALPIPAVSRHGRNDTVSGDAVGNTIVRVLEPEAPTEPIAKPLTRMLLSRWFGSSVLATASIVDGLAGVVAARTEEGPTV